MELNELTALSPIDGRYRNKTAALAPYLSEWGLMKYRVEVEVEYFIALVGEPALNLPALEPQTLQDLRSIYTAFSEADAEKIKAFERVTNHDVKAVEYFIKERMSELGCGATGYPLWIDLPRRQQRDSAFFQAPPRRRGIHSHTSDEVCATLLAQAREWRDIPMLARTHGQPASPVTLGKEWAVFVDRLDVQLAKLKALDYPAKFGGATGQFNAHLAAYPNADWVAFANRFVGEGLGLTRSQITTQIEHYDGLAEWCDTVRRIQVILMDLCKDVWTYISHEYFKQKIKAGEVGSSAMPHKVNPIDFENAEGNWGVSNAVLQHFAEKLPISRLQRDLTDSTVLRNLSVPLGHSLVALQSLQKGLGKLLLNTAAIQADLDANWAIGGKPDHPAPGKCPKPTGPQVTRQNTAITEESIEAFIQTLDVSEEIKQELHSLSPSNYIGLSAQLVDGLKDH